jgi:hypothetical protein
MARLIAGENVLAWSAALQVDMMHGVTEAVMAALPEPHWQT